MGDVKHLSEEDTKGPNVAGLGFIQAVLKFIELTAAEYSTTHLDLLWTTVVKGSASAFDFIAVRLEVAEAKID